MLVLNTISPTASPEPVKERAVITVPSSSPMNAFISYLKNNELPVVYWF
jgi:hypothetical protein